MAATWRFSDSPGRLEAADDTVWFQYHRLAFSLLDVITIAGEDGEPEPGKVLAEIVSVVPALPAGATLTVSSSIPAVSALITFEAASASVLQGADVPVIGIDWQAQRGQAGGTVFAFADVPAGAAEVRGPKRGRATPPAAAANPRKPMAKLNVHATWALVQP